MCLCVGCDAYYVFLLLCSVLREGIDIFGVWVDRSVSIILFCRCIFGMTVSSNYMDG